MNEGRTHIENNPKILRKRAHEILVRAKEQEARLLASGAKWQRVDSPVRTHILKQ